MSQIYKDMIFLGEPKPASMDNHAHAVESDGDEFHRCTFDAKGASEALKSSKHWHLLVVNGRSVGGVEDCHDFVRGGDLVVTKHTFDRGDARQDVTLKASFRGALYQDNPGLALIEAGNYSKYDAKAIYPDGRVVKASPFKCCRPPVRACHVSVLPGQPKVVVKLFHSEPWTGDVINKPLVPWMGLHRRLVAFYFWFRAVFFKEKHPTPEAEFQLLPEEI